MKYNKLIILFVLFCSVQLFAQSFLESITNGKFSGEFQLGYEYSDYDDAANLEPATGLELRTRIEFKTADYKGFSFFIQGQNVSFLIDDFSFPGGGDSNYDVIADPDGSRVHQAYLDFNMFGNSSLRIGRQEILLDDVRLIGNVGWRQNAQSFDAVTFKTNYKRNDLTVSYIDAINTIYLTRVKLDYLLLLNNSYKMDQGGTLSTFAYFLDTESIDPASRDCATYGIRMVDKLFDMELDVTYAVQQDYADGEGHGGDMLNIYLSDRFGKTSTLGLGMNKISGQHNLDRPFDTLFSTAHKFNGWSDQFLSTNGGNLVNGLLDLFVQINGNSWGGNWTIAYHKFDTTETGQGFEEKYGSEINAVFVKKLSKNFKFLVKYAKYTADQYEKDITIVNPTHDETVYWGRIIYTF